MQNFQNTKISEYKTFKAQKIQNTKISEYKSFKVQKF